MLLLARVGFPLVRPFRAATSIFGRPLGSLPADGARDGLMAVVGCLFAVVGLIVGPQAGR